MSAPVVLCATDLTQASARTVDLAVAVTTALKGTLELVYVIDDQEHAIPRDAQLQDHVTELLQAAQANKSIMHERLDAQRQDAEKSGVAVNALITHGRPWVRVPELAEERSAAMVVIGARELVQDDDLEEERPTYLQQRVLGSTADRIVRAVGRPLFVATGGEPIPPGLKGARWLVGIDYSPASCAALGLVQEIVDVVGGEIHLANAVRPAGGEEKSDDERTWRQLLREGSKREAEAQLHEWVKDNASDVTAHQIVSPDSPASALCATALTLEADLIAIGPQSHSVLGRILLGSNAEECLRESPVPVMLVPA